MMRLPWVEKFNLEPGVIHDRERVSFVGMGGGRIGQCERGASQLARSGSSNAWEYTTNCKAGGEKRG